MLENEPIDDSVNLDWNPLNKLCMICDHNVFRLRATVLILLILIHCGFCFCFFFYRTSTYLFLGLLVILANSLV